MKFEEAFPISTSDPIVYNACEYNDAHQGIFSEKKNHVDIIL